MFGNLSAAIDASFKIKKGLIDFYQYVFCHPRILIVAQLLDCLYHKIERVSRLTHALGSE